VAGETNPREFMRRVTGFADVFLGLPGAVPPRRWSSGTLIAWKRWEGEAGE
jgi:hypothetical protein